MPVTVTKTIEIDYGHTLPDHFGFCNQLHGHRGIIKVTVEGPVQTKGSSAGMVYDFKLLKELMIQRIHDVLDHGFAVWKEDKTPITLQAATGYGLSSVSISTLAFVLARNQKVLVTEEPPTAEYLAKWCYQQLVNELPDEIRLVKVEFYETPNSSAIYIPE